MKVYKIERDATKKSIEYEKELNEQQLAVVQSTSRSALVLAGPGSGKTRVLVYRVAYLLEQGVEPGAIMLLTFTNRASKEMLRRVEEIIGTYPRGLLGGTFHHLGNMMLRRHADLVGLSPNFSIIDSEDAKLLIKDITASLDEGKTKHFPSAAIVHSIISFATNARISVEACIKKKYETYEQYTPFIVEIAARYNSRKRHAHMVDFDDLLSYWNLILDNEKVREYYGRILKHVLVDEFQDTNRLQSEILRKLTMNRVPIMVVGDDCQSIYSFRAAEIENILEFPKKYEDCKEYKLEVNYRSTPEILKLVNESILKNTKQFKKTLTTPHPNGTKPALVRCATPAQEASFIGQRILDLKEQGISYKEIGVLFRAEYQSAEVELDLMRRGIPFQKRGGLRFFEQAHIKDVTAFLKIIANNKDELAWKRFVCLFQGIGPAKAITVWNWVSKTHDPLKHIASVDMQVFGRDLGRGWNDIKQIIRKIPESENPSELITAFLANYYEEYLKETYPNFKERLLDVKQYVNLSLQYKNITKFLEDILLDADLTAKEGAEEGEDEYVILSTIHQAKGLEWKAVFVVSVAEDRFPLERAYADDSIEEERRLFYVACSRAKKELYLTLPMQEYTYWGGYRILRDSIFIEELPEGVYEEWQIEDEKGDFVSADKL